MIAQISGKVIEVSDTSITVQVNNLAYEILVPSSVITFYKHRSPSPSPANTSWQASPSPCNGERNNLGENQSLPRTGFGSEEELDTFYTIQYIEGSSGHGNQFVRFVGFKRKIEKDFFQLYTSVEGVGYKTALKSLIFPIQKIAMAIENNDVSALKKLPHIGSRTAEKMIATLKGRMKKFILDQENQPLTVPVEPDLHLEVVQVLKQVGYSPSEAEFLINKVLQKNPKMDSAEQMIQEIFSIRKEEVS
jgi:Holliday junction DNA helicase RuvA